MNNIVLLTRLFLKNGVNQGLGRRKSSNGKNKKLSFWMLALIMLLGAIAFGVGIWYMVSEIYNLLSVVNAQNTIISFGIRGVTSFIFITGIISVLTYFYFTSDVEMILPLPVKPYEIVAARFIVINIIQYTILAVVLIPLFLRFGISSGAGVLYYINCTAVFFLVPVVPTALATIICMVIMNFANLSKNGSFARTLAALLGIGISIGANLVGYYMRKSSMSDQGFQTLAQNANNSSFAKFTNIFYSVKFEIDSITYSNSFKGFLSLLAVIALVLISFVVVCAIGQKLYIKAMSKMNNSNSKKKALTEKSLDKKVNQNSVMKAYFMKDLKSLFKTQAFFFQCVMQNLILIVILFVSNLSNAKSLKKLVSVDFIKSVNLNSSAGATIVIILLMIIFLLSALNPTSSTSISREGKNAFAMKYMPIDYFSQIVSKSLLGIIVNAIFPILFIVIAVFFNFDLAISIDILFLMILGIVFSSLTGVIVDLMKPKLDWDNEYAAVKQNINSLKNALVNIIFGSFIGLLLYLKVSAIVASSIIGLVYIAGIAGIVFYTKKNADKLFKNIN